MEQYYTVRYGWRGRENAHTGETQRVGSLIFNHMNTSLYRLQLFSVVQIHRQDVQTADCHAEEGTDQQVFTQLRAGSDAGEDSSQELECAYLVVSPLCLFWNEPR